ncbi:UNVERIFIED_CONTAM: Rho GDP-dissociation inhibitor 1 [Sesamum radiatum]|uniref:Rho GDP-dissociation inhibitor 1 n=1 Tax=Sesamum radiatum TaxID=300843 RepID=A0AAW2LS30_SESRA
MSLAVGVASSSKGMGFDENKAEGSEANKDHESGGDNEGSISRKMSDTSLYTTEDEDDEDTETKIQLGPQCTLKELSEKDKDDESLRRWKEQLLGSVDVESVGETLDPEVKILDLAIVSPGRDDILLQFLMTETRKAPVDSTKEMIGTFSPQPEAYTHEMPEETTPSGMFARGSYSAKTQFLDDDNKCYLELNYTFEIKKDWQSQ